MKFRTYLVPSKAAKMTPETATPLGEVEFAKRPLPGHMVTVSSVRYVVVHAPAEWPKASIKIAGKLPEDSPEDVYVIPA